MQDDLETIFKVGGITLARDRDRRLYINGDPIVTDSKLTLDRWTKGAALLTAFSAFTLAVVEVGRALSLWN